MMMPSTMILTICISMVLKRNRGLSLDIGHELCSRRDRFLRSLANSTNTVISFLCSLSFS